MFRIVGAIIAVTMFIFTVIFIKNNDPMDGATGAVSAFFMFIGLMILFRG